MGAREFYIKSSKLPLEELAKKIMEVQEQNPYRLYDLAPITIEFNNDFTNRMGEKFTIEAGEKFLLISGDGNYSINEFLSHLPADVAETITGYNTLDFHHQEIHNYIKVTKHTSMDEMINLLEKGERQIDNVAVSQKQPANVEQLMSVLTEQRQTKEEQMISLLLDQMKEMEKGYASSLQALTAELKIWCISIK